MAPTPPAGEPNVVGAVVDGDGPPVPVTSFALSSDDLSVEIWDHGARIVGIFAPDASGEYANVVLRHPTLGDYTSDGHAYFGATIGRHANRISHARIRIGGRTYELDANEGAHQLHGGPVGFDQHVWKTVGFSPNTVMLRHVSLNGDQGFPGNVVVDVTYALAGSRLTIETTATTDADTVFGTTNHTYWNLAGDGTIADHVLTAPAKGVVPVDDELIPTGHINAVAGSHFDFTEPASLQAVTAAGGIDHCLVFTEAGATASLAHLASGRSLTITSNQPGLQVYTGQYLPDPFSGLCLEPQQLPNTPNHPEFGTSLLRPGERYRHHVMYDFGIVAPKAGDDR